MNPWEEVTSSLRRGLGAIFLELPMREAQMQQMALDRALATQRLQQEQRLLPLRYSELEAETNQRKALADYYRSRVEAEQTQQSAAKELANAVRNYMQTITTTGQPANLTDLAGSLAYVGADARYLPETLAKLMALNDEKSRNVLAFNWPQYHNVPANAIAIPTLGGEPQRGIVTLSQGEVAHLPSGQTLAGLEPRKPTASFSPNVMRSLYERFAQSWRDLRSKFEHDWDTYNAPNPAKREKDWEEHAKRYGMPVQPPSLEEFQKSYLEWFNALQPLIGPLTTTTNTPPTAVQLQPKLDTNFKTSFVSAPATALAESLEPIVARAVQPVWQPTLDTNFKTSFTNAPVPVPTNSPVKALVEPLGPTVDTNLTAPSPVRGLDWRPTLDTNFKTSFTNAPTNLSAEALVEPLRQLAVTPEALPPLLTNASVPVVSNAAPAISNAVPIVSNAVPIVSNTAPVISNTVPVVSNTVPVVSNTVPAVSNTVPVVSNAPASLAGSSLLSALQTNAPVRVPVAQPARQTNAPVASERAPQSDVSPALRQAFVYEMLKDEYMLLPQVSDKPVKIVDANDEGVIVEGREGVIGWNDLKDAKRLVKVFNPKGEPVLIELDSFDDEGNPPPGYTLRE